MIEAYLSWLKENKGRAPRTAEKYGGHLRLLAGFMAGKGIPLAEASLDDLQEFSGLYAHRELKLTARARRPLVAAVRGFFAWAKRQGKIPGNPAAELEYPQAGRRLPRALSLADAEQILQRCDLYTFQGVRDAALLGVLFGCGPRVSGLVGLNEDDLLWGREGDREHLVLRFREKGGKERLVPAPLETALLLHAYLGHEELDRIDRTLPSGERVLFVSIRNRRVPEHAYIGEARRLSVDAVLDRLRHYGEACGIPVDRLHPHAARHLFGTEMVEEDVNPHVHQDLMGHADIKSTSVYVQLAMRRKTEAIDRASPMRRIQSPVSGLARQIEGRGRAFGSGKSQELKDSGPGDTAKPNIGGRKRSISEP